MFLEALTSVTAGGTGNVLQWDSDGYYKVGEDNWQDIEIEATFIYKGGVIGLIPRYYSEYTYVHFTIGKSLYKIDNEFNVVEERDMALFSLHANEEEIELGNKLLTQPLVVDNEYTLRAVITKHNYQIFVNDELQFNVEYGGGIVGNACVYASTGNQCTNIAVKSNFPTEWVSNVEAISGATVYISKEEDENKLVRLENPSTSTEDLYIEQIITLPEERNITFYSSYMGECRMVVRYVDGLQTGEEIVVEGPLTPTWVKIEGKTVVPDDCTEIVIRFYVGPGTDAVINDIQVEPGKLSTSYIHNDSVIDSASRASSHLTFPSKGLINNQTGSVSMWIKPNVTYDASLNKKYMLFQYGNPVDGIMICGIDNTLYVQHGSTSQLFNGLPIEKDEWYHIVMTWDSQFVTLHINGWSVSEVSTDLYDEEADIVNIGFDDYSDYEAFNGVIDDLIIYKTALDNNDVESIYTSTTPIVDSGEMTLRATFNHAIGSFSKTYVEIPNAPEYGSPVILQKEDGTALRKVSFLDYKTGAYKTWNEESLIYDGDSFIQVAFDGLDVDNFKVSVLDQEGYLIGEPYRVEGKKIFMTLTNQEKEKYKGTEIYAQYQLEDSYTVDFNIKAADSFRVDLAKHDGQSATVIYEGNRFSQEKLADMIEMNPLLNPNHEGFLYVSQTAEPITSFKVKITPPDMIADGVSEGLIIVEPVDINGNHVCEAQLEITSTHGVIYPSLEMEATRLRQIAGRYMYRYVSPRKFSTVEGEIQTLIDSIRIVDKETGIGVEKYVTLCLYDNYFVDVIDPKDKNAVSPELMGAFLLEKVVEHIGQSILDLPVELRVLNFTNTGMINIKDVTWIKEKLYTTDLQKIYQDVLKYTQEG